VSRNGDTQVGSLVVRQSGGVSGTDEVQIYHDGTHGYIETQQEL